MQEEARCASSSCAVRRRSSSDGSSTRRGRASANWVTLRFIGSSIPVASSIDQSCRKRSSSSRPTRLIRSRRRDALPRCFDNCAAALKTGTYTRSMKCPRCGSEYREGFTRCTDCDLELVPSAPPPEAGDVRSHIELVKVFEGGNPAVIPLVESLFEDAGIEYSTSS